jgi:hypothetical protein
MATGKVLGTVTSAIGEVKATAPDGTVRLLQVGDKVFTDEVITTSAQGTVNIALENGRALECGNDTNLALNESMLGTATPSMVAQDAVTPPSVAAQQEVGIPPAGPPDVAALQAAIAAGADPSQVAEATAAGGEDGGGGTPVIIDQANTTGNVTSGFLTGGGSIDFPTIEPALSPVVETVPLVVDLTPKAGGSELTFEERDLSDGSTQGEGFVIRPGEFSVVAENGLATLEVGDITLTLAQLQALGTTQVTIVDDIDRLLMLTDYDGDASGGTVSYSYTLQDAVTHAPGGGANSAFDDFAVMVTDEVGDTASSTLSVQIVDDLPTAAAHALSQTAQTSDTNLMIILDISGSMTTATGVGGMSRLELAKASILELFEQYDALGNVKIKLITFSSSASNASDGWVDIATAKNTLLDLAANGNTNYDDALNTASNAFGTSGKIAGAQNVSYFLSDGLPNTSTISGSPNNGFGNSSGIAGSETTAWTGFLNTNDIKSYALGMGSGATQSALDPIAYDGTGTGADINGQVITDLSQLTATLVSTVDAQISGNIATNDLGGFGADGGHVASIAVNGTTYNFAGTTVGTSHGSFNGTTHEWTVTTSAGGTTKVDMDDGTYTYTSPSTISGVLNEPSIGYTLIDNDGDTASSGLSITINPALSPMVVRDDVVVTNQSSIAIPDWALLANDTGPNSATQSITGVGSAASGDSVAHAPGTVTYTDGNTDGGSFSYTDTGGSNTDTGSVTVTRDTSGAIDGTFRNEIMIGGSAADNINGAGGNDILIGGGVNSTMSGGEGNDILVGGAGNDIITGSAGGDTYKWLAGDEGTVVTPAVDTVNGITENAGDKLDLGELLQGESSGTLGAYLNFTASGGNTTVEVNSLGAAGGVDQKIVLTGVDLTNGGASNDSQIIANLLSQSKLITD